MKFFYDPYLGSLWPYWLIRNLISLRQLLESPSRCAKIWYEHFKESGIELPYSPNHHAKDIQAIKRVIKTNNSLLVRGLSGSGKSSLLRFLVANPAAQSRDILFVYIDCNGLDWNRNKEAVQEEMCVQIIKRLLVQSESVGEIGRAKTILRSLIEEFSRNSPVHLVVIFDRSELLQSKLDETFFNYLRALRDINPRLSYIFSGRDILRNVFGEELGDILWGEPYWIGALSIDDAKWTINRHLTRLDIELEREMVRKLLTCVGRHPGLLKLACQSVQAEKINLNDPEEKVIEQLLAEQAIDYQCRDIWRDLDFTTQEVLRRMARAETLPLMPPVEWLIRCGILEQGKNDDLEFTSSLFKKYVANLGLSPLTMRERIVFKGSEKVILSREEFNLFKVLWDNQPYIVSSDQISESVWPDEQGVSPQMITNLVKRVRDKLGDNHYIKTTHGRGYNFVQGTAPLPRNSDIHPSMPTK